MIEYQGIRAEAATSAQQGQDTLLQNRVLNS